MRAQAVKDGYEEYLSSKSTVELKPGEMISYRTSAGGGYGDPYKCDPEAVPADVLAGKISSERASERYGVAIDITAQRVDESATQVLRRDH